MEKGRNDNTVDKMAVEEVNNYCCYQHYYHFNYMD
jgi:hypothetical protein